MLTRRAFATQSLAASGALLFGVPKALAGPCAPVEGALWGDLPSNCWPGRTSYKILEIHLYGGLSPWETFYHRPSSDGSGWRGFSGDLTDPATAPIWSTTGHCRYFPHDPGASTPSVLTTLPFDLTDTDHPIHLGPATAPLWTDDIISRMRCFVTAHDLLPHEAAIPYAATGLRLGRPNFAGLGAAIQHRRHELELTRPEAERRKSPASYVCAPAEANFPNDNLDAFTAIGTHPGSSKPVTLKVGGQSDFVALLERKGMTAPADDLLHLYRQVYRDMMTPGGPQAMRLRSRGFAEYDSSLEFLFNAGALRTVLTDDLFRDINDPLCVTLPGQPSNPAQNVPRMSLTVAASLLSNPIEPADYVCVIDGGMARTLGGGYDTHNGVGHVMATFANLYNTLASLRDLIDLGMIDLRSTLVILNTEFGRTPIRNGDGRDHWPDGYVITMIGGPISQVHDARGNAPRMIGRIEDPTAHAADRYLTVTDLRAGALLAAGICPFESEIFGIGDLSTQVAGTSSHDIAVTALKREVFGILS